MMHDFTAIYDLYKDPIFRYCLWKCRDRDVGQDMMQETFLRFFLCLQREEEIRLPRAFLYRIAHNLFISHARRKKEASLEQLIEAGFEPIVDPWHATYNRLASERPLQMLNKLRTPYRQAVRHRFIGGLSPAEIAQMTGESSNTISVRIFRGLKHLRSLLEEHPREHSTHSF